MRSSCAPQSADPTAVQLLHPAAIAVATDIPAIGTIALALRPRIRTTAATLAIAIATALAAKADG